MRLVCSATWFVKFHRSWKSALLPRLFGWTPWAWEERGITKDDINDYHNCGKTTLDDLFPSPRVWRTCVVDERLGASSVDHLRRAGRRVGAGVALAAGNGQPEAARHHTRCREYRQVREGVFSIVLLNEFIIREIWQCDVSLVTIAFLCNSEMFGLHDVNLARGCWTNQILHVGTFLSIVWSLQFETIDPMAFQKQENDGGANGHRRADDWRRCSEYI